MKHIKLPSLLMPLYATLRNLLVVYVVYFIARIAYLLVNFSYLGQGLTFSHLMEMLGGGLVFDTSAILVTNIPYIVLMLLPWHGKENKTYQRICRMVYLFINGIALAMNLCDSVYFQYTMRRTTSTVFSEFSNEGNLGSIFLTETLRHFYLVLLFVFIIWAMYKLYCPTGLRKQQLRWLTYDASNLLSLAVFAPFVIAGIRGGFTTAVRPITISNANQYVNRPVEAALVLNTPFSMYRTIGKAVFVVPDYYADAQEMALVYSPIHEPVDSLPMQKKNVVVLIVESFGREYIGALNKNLENGRYKGYTPCIDSLISQSITFSRSYCNGRKSIDGMPSVLSSIPMFVEPFFLTPASMNHVSGIASLLAGEGYQTAFFHGAQRGSMGFQAFSRATGFQDYYGREDYDTDKRFGGDADFDGMWAIWDEPFLQYYATKMSEMKEPFMTAVFTASSHHPYVIPEKYKNTYPEEGIIIHKCIRYTDMALGKFFATASKQPWFKNTIFVLTSDHTNLSDHAYYQTDLGGFCSPIIIYEPGRTDCQPEIQDKIAQQIDILPTIMGMLHYPEPYFGFGIDVLNTPAEDTWAVNYLNGIYQYVKHGHVLQFDGQHTRAVYALQDSLMRNNLKGKVEQQSQMERELKAIIQQYMERMTQDRLTP
ncbi:LTA synthase family protein [Prevotella sp. P6B4]|uniref:LTA synthase family protein n=1 Tax=Prevotella sp. P6B4 TaxID=1410614 RepID=UPI00056CAB2C|nr:alkaline phosphatase family protein [Prevotella sp. P6B4]